MNFGGSGMIKAVFDRIRTLVPDGGHILELGSGDVSTQYLGVYYHVTSIESELAWIGKHNATYIHAPLKDGWYDVDVLKAKLPNIRPYYLIFIDGCGKRRKFLDHTDLFNLNVPIFVDDIYRDSEMVIATELSTLLNRPFLIIEEPGSGPQTAFIPL